MAGFYPDVPGFRFEYDRDGSVVVADGTTIGLPAMQYLNSEAGAGISGPTSGVAPGVFFGVAWPEPRTLVGVYMSAQYVVSMPATNAFYTSVDTTNVSDGTWVAQGTINTNQNADNHIACRTLIEPKTGTGLRGVKFDASGFFAGGPKMRVFHVYGQTPLTENPDRLVLCDATGAVNSDGAYFDFGDSARATSDTIHFRIGNNSSSKTANSVAVSFECLYDAGPSLLAQHDFSVNGGSSWVTSYTIPHLAPGAVTPEYILRRNTAAGAAVGPWQLRLCAVPASMT